MRAPSSGGAVACLLTAVLLTSGCGSPRTPAVYADLNDADVQQRIADIRAGGGSSGTQTTATVAQTTGWGTLKGVFKFQGSAPAPALVNITKDPDFCGKHNLLEEALLVDGTGGIANVVIFVRTKNVAIHPDLAASVAPEAVFDNKNCRFEPHILPVWIQQQTLVMHNSDPVGHNTNMQPTGDIGVNPILPTDGMVRHTFNRDQQNPVSVACNIHPWMRGYVVPRKNPYVAVTATDGSFTLDKIPAGKLEFQVWHEMAGGSGGGLPAKSGWTRGRFTMTIPEDGVEDLGTVLVPASAFQ